MGGTGESALMLVLEHLVHVDIVDATVFSIAAKIAGLGPKVESLNVARPCQNSPVTYYEKFVFLFGLNIHYIYMSSVIKSKNIPNGNT